MPRKKDPLSKGKEVLSSKPKRRSQRNKSKKPSYRVDSASEDAHSHDKDVEASQVVRLEDYGAFKFVEAGPSQIWEEMTKVQWESVVEMLEAPDREMLKNCIGLEAVATKMKVVGQSESYKVMMQRILHQCQIYQAVEECLN